jgi:hypothetical protein
MNWVCNVKNKDLSYIDSLDKEHICVFDVSWNKTLSLFSISIADSASRQCVDHFLIVEVETCDWEYHCCRVFDLNTCILIYSDHLEKNILLLSAILKLVIRKWKMLHPRMGAFHRKFASHPRRKSASSSYIWELDFSFETHPNSHFLHPVHPDL